MVHFACLTPLRETIEFVQPQVLCKSTGHDLKPSITAALLGKPHLVDGHDASSEQAARHPSDVQQGLG